MGLEKLAKSAGGDKMVEWMSHLDIKAYVAASNSWLWYNESAKMAKLEAPLLWIWPAGDGAFGAFMPLKAIKKEMRLAPEDLPKEIKVFNKTGKEGHGYYAEDPDAYFGAVAEWIRRFPNGRPSASPTNAAV